MAGRPVGHFWRAQTGRFSRVPKHFHDGSQASLEQVLDFYSRNGDFPDGGNLGPGIGNIRLSQAERTAMPCRIGQTCSCPRNIRLSQAERTAIDRKSVV